MKKVQLNEDYNKLEKVSLNTVKGFFTEQNFKSLIVDYGILTLKDLFEQIDNGKLFNKIQKMNYISAYQRDDFWLTVNGTVNILKCKYFGKELVIREDMPKEEYFKVLGFSVHDGYRFNCANLNTFSQLITAVKNNDYTSIYGMQFSKDKNESIINRVKVVYNYLYGIKEKNDDLEFISNDLDLSLQELNDLYDKLKNCIEESKKLDLEIETIKIKIENKKEKIKTLVK